ncbi:hypothetical protein diail_6629 [Diaporthe ilicicola]|nr:hypothetical protein diail_6629 [Diaporthe ilicicola]
MATVNSMLQNSPFAKLFSVDPPVDSQLQKLRDKIYSFAWSRKRRDEGKLDWVVSENGVNRNVPLRWVEEARSGLDSDSTDKRSCWLFLVNKQISADFTRFIYSVNDLDVSVDLKAVHTKQNEAKLDKIVTFLQNTNFQRYTRSARIRIHFPDNYPFQNLPAFNQHALEKIAAVLDKFQQLTHVTVRIVPRQDPEVYELRLATFPFYPMSMTNWSVRMLNSSTYTWDIVGGEQVHQLNLAWDLFRATGSLTATVHARNAAQKSTIDGDPALAAKEGVGVSSKPMVIQKKNGSQKRKGRKLRALPAATAPSVSKATSQVPSNAVSSQSSSHLPAPSKGNESVALSDHIFGPEAKSSQVQSLGAEMSIHTAGETPGYAPPVQLAAGSTHPPSPPPSLTKLKKTHGVMETSTYQINDEVVERDTAGEQRPLVAENAKHAREDPSRIEQPQMACPFSPASSCVTLGRYQTDDEAAPHTKVERTSDTVPNAKGAEADDKKLGNKKKRRNRKKVKKPRVDNTTEELPIDRNTSQMPAEAREKDETVPDDANDAREIISLMPTDWNGVIFNAKPHFPLTEIVDLSPWNGSDTLIAYTRENGSHGILPRTSDLDRLLRQKKRKAVQEKERKAERMRTKEKRQVKKMKEVLIRRKEPSDDLRRVLEDTKQLAESKQGSDLKKRLGDIAEKCLEEEVRTYPVDSSEGTDSNDEDSISPGSWSTTEEPCYPQSEYPVHHRRLDRGDSDISHQFHQPSSSDLSAKVGNRNSTPWAGFFDRDHTCQDDSQAGCQEHKELEYPSTDCTARPTSNHAHGDSHYIRVQCADQSESSSSRGSSEPPATDTASAYQNQRQGRRMEEQRLTEVLDDSDDCRSTASQYGDERLVPNPEDDSSGV